jgi:septum formation protein
MTLILASGSKSRAQLLRQAGVPFEIQVPRVDERAVKEAMLAEEAPARDIADKLAELKAFRIAQKNPTALVLGGDQVLVQGNRLFDKPTSREEAAEHLHSLSGRAHELLAAAVLFEDGKPVWRTVGRAQCIMRSLSEAFIDQYLDEAGDDILNCVGCYQLEGLGSQLFTRVQGDYFSVLGLPLLELLHVLRQRGIIPS